MDSSPTGSRGPVRVEPATKRVRIMLGGQVVLSAHPRAPYPRVHIWRPPGPVRIGVGGAAGAEPPPPPSLSEPGPPRRTYVPKLDVRMDLLEPTDSATMCPYKGTARYWSV